jgi:urease accessory protein
MGPFRSLPAIGLLLADARLPTGGHAHSAGAEQAVEDGIVADLAGLASFLAGRLGSSVILEAHAAALACHLERAGQLGSVVVELEDALDARTASPAARAIRRRQGEQYRRAATAVLDRRSLAVLDRCRPPGPPLPIVIGVAAAAAGLWPSDAATIVAYSSLTASATAALRLLGLDPFAVSSTLAELAPDLDRIAAEAAAGVGGGIAGLPAPTAPVLDFLFEEHSRRKDRLFAS